MKLSKRLSYEILFAASLVLGSCTPGRGLTEDRITDLATEAADSAIDDSEKIRALESKLTEAEAKAEDLEGRLSMAEQEVAEIYRLRSRISDLESRLNM